MKTESFLIHTNARDITVCPENHWQKPNFEHASYSNLSTGYSALLSLDRTALHSPLHHPSKPHHHRIQLLHIPASRNRVLVARQRGMESCSCSPERNRRNMVRIFYRTAPNRSSPRWSPTKLQGIFEGSTIKRLSFIVLWGCCSAHKSVYWSRMLPGHYWCGGAPRKRDVRDKLKIAAYKTQRSVSGILLQPSATRSIREARCKKPLQKMILIIIIFWKSSFAPSIERPNCQAYANGDSKVERVGNSLGPL